MEYICSVRYCTSWTEPTAVNYGGRKVPTSQASCAVSGV